MMGWREGGEHVLQLMSECCFLSTSAETQPLGIYNFIVRWGTNLVLTSLSTSCVDLSYSTLKILKGVDSLHKSNKHFFFFFKL